MADLEDLAETVAALIERVRHLEEFNEALIARLADQQPPQWTSSGEPPLFTAKEIKAALRMMDKLAERRAEKNQQAKAEVERWEADRTRRARRRRTVQTPEVEQEPQPGLIRQPNRTPTQRSMQARLAAQTRWARTTPAQRAEATLPARRALQDKWAASPNPEAAREAHMLRMALASSRARAKP